MRGVVYTCLMPPRSLRYPVSPTFVVGDSSMRIAGALFPIVVTIRLRLIFPVMRCFLARCCILLRATTHLHVTTVYHTVVVVLYCARHRVPCC